MAVCSARIELKDIVKPGIRERFDALRRMGIRTVMVTGDNRVTAAAIATEVGRGRLPRGGQAAGQAGLHPPRAGRGPSGRHVRGRHQRRARARPGRCGRRHADRHPGRARGGNMVDLDSDPTKLIEVVEIGKQLLITRGSLTTFSIANDVSQILRDPAGDLRRDLSGAAGAQRHAARHAAERDPVGGHLQRADHRGAGAAGACAASASRRWARRRCSGATC